jgi:hypothetical protein
VYSEVNAQMLPIAIVVRNRDHSRLSSSPSSSFRVKRQNQPNRLRLTPVTPAAYLRNSRRQAHFACVDRFQTLRLREWPFFSKIIAARAESNCWSPGRHGMSCSPSHRVVTRAGVREGKNIPTVEAGTSIRICKMSLNTPSSRTSGGLRPGEKHAYERSWNVPWNVRHAGKKLRRTSRIWRVTVRMPPISARAGSRRCIDV